MNFQRGNQSRYVPLGKYLVPISLPLAILPLICAVSMFSTARASTFLDPLLEPSTTQFGHAIVSMGDLNGDGVPDFAVAAPFQDGDFVSTLMGFGLPQNVGKIFVIDGATFATLSVMNDPDYELIQPQHFGGQLGTSISASADINGDGKADLIAGVPHHIADPDTLGEEINAGKALVFSGADGSLLFTLEDPEEQEDGKFGNSVAALGDLDGDGTADFVVGAPGKDIPDEDGVGNVGQAFVFSGKTGALLMTLDDPPRGGDEAGAAFGTAVAKAGDVDRDRVTDIVVGAPGEGRVYVFSGKTFALLYSIISPTADPLPSFGAAVAGDQDMNRDRVPDIVIGAPLQTGFLGAAYIYNGTNGTLIRKLKAPLAQTFARFGASVYVSPDITGDRRGDVIVGAPGQDVNGLEAAGQAYIYNGTTGRLFATLSSETPQSNAGYGIGLASAVFSGRTATAVVGAPFQDTVGQDAVTHLQAGQIEIPQ